MKHKHFLILLLAAGFVALLTLSCGEVGYPSIDTSAHVRLLNAMIREGSDTVSCYVSLDGQPVAWDESRQIGSTSPRRWVAGRHRIQLTDRPAGVQGARVLLSADIQIDQFRYYTCVLTGEIPDSGADSTATALLVADDLYRVPGHVGIRLVNAGIPFDSCRLISGSDPDTLIAGPIGHLQSTGYVTLPPGDYQISVCQSADTFHLVVGSTTTCSFTAYYIGAPKYTQLPRAPHGVFLIDTP